MSGTLDTPENAAPQKRGFLKNPSLAAAFLIACLLLFLGVWGELRSREQEPETLSKFEIDLEWSPRGFAVHGTGLDGHYLAIYAQDIEGLARRVFPPLGQIETLEWPLKGEVRLPQEHYFAATGVVRVWVCSSRDHLPEFAETGLGIQRLDFALNTLELAPKEILDGR